MSIDALIAKLESCLGNLGIALTTILEPQRATQAYQTPDFISYRTTEIGIITDYLQPDTLNNEWTTLKRILSRVYTTDSNPDWNPSPVYTRSAKSGSCVNRAKTSIQISAAT